MIHSPSAYIDPEAIRHNLRYIQRLVGKQDTTQTPKIWAVVKSDAYGHGLAHVLPALHDADGLAVLTLDEVYACRQLGWHKPILLLSCNINTSDLNDPVLFPLHLVIDHPQQIIDLECGTNPTDLYVWLRYAGELHHAGIQAKDYPSNHQRLTRLVAAGRLAGVGHLQHYANADTLQALDRERQQFQQITSGLSGPYCTENSASALTTPNYATSTTWLRIGIALYGISPFHGTHGVDLGLKPAMTLQAPIYNVQHLQSGDSLGYGSLFQATGPVRIGLVRCGYAYGYPRSIPGTAYCWIDGKPARLIGQVSMDTLSIDISEHPAARPGSVVTLWGKQGPCIEAIAQAAHTIPAQLCTALTSRVVRQQHKSHGPQ